ncbi:MAG: type II toxin-antitoxin system VapC family toxin [Deltaproteobacteria bacterium]|nr:type II toxin-antitoxin system VapC family toxin [Deltaproteobacteria bacterium]
MGWLFDDPKLPVGIKRFVRDKNNEIFVSAASVWEITTKFRLGKLPQAAKVAKNVPEWIVRAGFESMPITPEHAQLAGAWIIPHLDPFDRMIAAQASLEKIPVATVDILFKEFPVKVFDG